MTQPSSIVPSARRRFGEALRSCAPPARCSASSARLAVRVVIAVSGATEEDLLGRSRLSSHAFARQLLALLLRDVLGASYPEIGLVLRRDHTTAMHAVRKMRERAAQPGGETAALVDVCSGLLRQRLAEAAASRRVA